MMTTDPAVPDDLLGWQAVLAAFEAGVAHHRLVLSDDADATESPWPPDHLPTTPIPPELRNAAAALLADADGVSEQLTGRLAGVPSRRGPRRLGRASTDHPRWTATL